jgi:hypothetical protein
MVAMQRSRTIPIALLVALLAVPAVALAATKVTLARYGAADGSVFKVRTSSTLSHGAASFALQQTSDGKTKTFTQTHVKPARNLVLRVGSALACGSPGVSVAYGSVSSNTKKVVATLVGGDKLRLSRSAAPKAWNFDGYAAAGIANSQLPVKRVDAYGADGKKLASAKFSSPQGC